MYSTNPKKKILYFQFFMMEDITRFKYEILNDMEVIVKDEEGEFPTAHFNNIDDAKSFTSQLNYLLKEVEFLKILGQATTLNNMHANEVINEFFQYIK